MTFDPQLEQVVRTALAEDLGAAGDLTAAAVVPEDAQAQAQIVAREDGVLSGVDAVTTTYALVDPRIEVTWHGQDGRSVTPGSVLATVRGPARGVLTGERVALNLLGRLSGVATATAELVHLVDGTGVGIADTRKTTPGLRALEKRAVLHGGGVNHRFGLHDAIMVKDNHIGFGGGLATVLRRLADQPRHMVTVEVEVDTLQQQLQVLQFDAERIARGLRPVCHAILLDNMTPGQVADGVRRARSHPAPLVVEVSGGVNRKTVRPLAEAGPDLISVGALTHSARCLDVGLDLAGPDLG
ncbi:nicotinate-nucleotide pyrophosphorylase [carboxylating] [Barrientosiimonas humi]|uniref:Nicotinate-nucleotide pyrophosphorylase [carboxylating] n=1 Tax=Barrientosiimonas humi TaxID=999931 RepID=A0A542XCJ0_9MICO|nr:carboxylating nicotinate-nucleotide diphosphorylase [Barrientosiimonas humi]TQL33572.1 nicotinate-nucleotide pyrophosphorylase [carboxylating] [Barrientosiimonas humi]CAG7573560.1 putative nicotinate-nucleotide pyrophosphorylase [carboxylating] [Barrientosiimonas humi]